MRLRSLITLCTVCATTLVITAEQSSRSRHLPVSSIEEGHQEMLRLLNQIAIEASEVNSYVGEGALRQARKNLAALPPSVMGERRWRLTMEAAEQELRMGNEDDAISLFSKSLTLVPSTSADSFWRSYTYYRLGVAYMRLGETQNCTRHPNAESCILPLREGGIHSAQEPSRNAIDVFTRVLDETPQPTAENLEEQLPSLHLAARWLLNIATMTIGEYPDSVPRAYLIPEKAFESDIEIPRFLNVAPSLGLSTFDMSGGVIVDDFNGDDYLDLIVSTWDVKGQLRFFLNKRDGTFTDQTEQAGLFGLVGGLNIVQADYDNDGDVDLFVMRGAWLHEHGRHPNSLLRNNGNGTFTDVTFAVGLGDVHYPTQTASWGDYDNDGDLDLYIGNESSSRLSAPNQLFRNNNDHTFTDVAALAGVMNHGYTKAVVWGDFDADRFLDLYVSNGDGRNRLYRNNGNGSFTNVARQRGVERPLSSFPAWFWDVDNDGVLDLYVSAYAADVEHMAASAMNLPVGVELARLYRGIGAGRFQDVSSSYNLGQPNAAMGGNFGDLNNDGYLDFYVGTGYPPYHSLMPNVMNINVKGSRFVDATYSGGFGHLQKGHGVAFADLDQDGDQDVFEQMGGAYPGDRFGNVLYENPGFLNHWISIKLIGVQSNRSAIGARIKIDLLEDGIRRSIYRHVNSGGSFGANPLRQTIGLGQAKKIEKLEIFWPTTGLTQTFSDVLGNQVIRIKEDQSSYERITLKVGRFGSVQ
tara:strand:+ start:1623 stop:3875 length:2253 start_codon:yes stop_codon:yes gene_type:complete